jgi:hypothetical protein
MAWNLTGGFESITRYGIFTFRSLRLNLQQVLRFAPLTAKNSVMLPLNSLAA